MSELKTLKLLHFDFSCAKLKQKQIPKQLFFDLFDIPGVIGLKLFEFFNYSKNEGIDFNDFIWAMSKLCRPKGEELNQAMFDIYSVCGRKTIGIDDLMTVLRTFEKEGIVEKLEAKIKSKSENKGILKSKSSVSPELDKLLSREWNETFDNKQINCIHVEETKERIKTIESYFCYEQSFIENDNIKKLVENTLIACGYMPENKLCINQFSYYIQQFPEFIDPILNLMKQEIWSELYTNLEIENAINGRENEECKTSPTTKFSYLSMNNSKIKVLPDVESKSELQEISSFTINHCNIITDENKIGTV